MKELAVVSAHLNKALAAFDFAHDFWQKQCEPNA
jgi:hypothetical protein